MHHESTNTMSRQTSVALNLGPTGDRQGNHYFYDIATNRVVVRVIDKHILVPMPEDIPAKLHKFEIMPEGIITDEENRETNYDEEIIFMMDQEFVPAPINPIDLMLGNDVEPISSSELNYLDVSGKVSEHHTNDADKSDTHVTQQPATIQLEHVPGELSEVTMSMDDNGAGSIGSNFGDNILSGADDWATMPSVGDDRTEQDK